MVYSSADSDVAQRGRSFGSHQCADLTTLKSPPNPTTVPDLRHAQSAEGRSSFSPALWRTKDEDVLWLGVEPILFGCTQMPGLV